MYEITCNPAGAWCMAWEFGDIQFDLKKKLVISIESLIPVETYCLMRNNLIFI